ncbi:MAG: ATP-binding cassette domain-containing protein [Bacteroidota bacterium]|nr:ATP-binding cassette domain-containing protein [Bacteroidota bacterium]MDX5427947.1 ATP-binding cassette domain-containing protein [Bacteroidota bacterium]MDX5447536.1 ATP-binding cassette domain-containing protein [Bacteroidota bacterium]MDX5505795.1 ATP-binding cassette domain-containing protein [Bacteroidota bacterium]
MSSSKEKKPRISKGSLKKALKLYKYIKPYRGQFTVGLIFLFLSSAANLAFPKLLGDLVNEANMEAITRDINRIALILLGVLVLQSIFSYFRVILFVNVTEKSLASLRQGVYQHLIRLPMWFFAEKRVGELNSRISADISLLQETFTTTLAEFIRQIIIIAGGITLLAITSVKLTLFMLAILPPVVLLAVFFGRYIRKYSKKVQGEVAESNTIVEETLQGIQNVKAFTNEFLEIGRYREKTDEVAATAIKGGKYRAAFSSFIILGLFGAIVAVIWMGTTLIATGELNTGQLFSFVLYSGFIGGSIGGMADVYARIQKTIGATEELLEILEEEIEPINDHTAERSDLRGSIAFEGVTFSYPSRKDITVLNHLSFEVQPGEQVALVGPSGAGKSTIVSLLYQFYHPQEGKILFDGRPADHYDLTDLRAHMALVPQDVFLFGGSIRENIAYGDPSAHEDQVIEAAKKANAWDFIQKFPEGLDTLVGERGVQLSGGQRQRIAIARALLHDPRILILDEATSALDSESEQLVQQALDTLMEGRTSIVIAHRLSTVRKADKILVIENGHIRETGTHEQLMQNHEGLYRALSEMQFAN